MGVDQLPERVASPAQSLPHPRSGRPPAFRVAWAILRLPALLAVLFLLRDWIASAVIDPTRVTLLVINVAGTPLARAAFFCAAAAVLAVVCLAAQRLGSVRGYWATLVVTTPLILATFHMTGTSGWLAVVVVAVLMTNLLPDQLYERVLRTPRLRDGAMATGIGIAELLFFRRYLAWAARPWTVPGRGLAALLPAVVLAAGAASVFVSAGALAGIEQALRMPSNARVLARGSFNWIELDVSGQHLFVTGHGVPRLLRLDAVDPAHRALRSPVETGGAQAFAYDPAAGELYVFNTRTRQLLYLDATTLEQKRAIDLPDLSPGDPWIAVDSRTDTLTIVSEADDETGVPFLVLDRTTGKVRDRRTLDAGNLYLRPDTSRLYLSFFRRRGRLLAYDLQTLSIAADAAAPPRVDRMAFLDADNEILLASPAESRIERFDATTLAPKGHFDAIFGVRVMAIDTVRSILFCGSLVTGEVAAIDLASGRRLGRFYLGPWLRTIQVDPARATAYVSSNGALYELRYDHLR